MECASCGSNYLIKHGYTAGGKQRYMCKDCYATVVFSPDQTDGPATEFLAIWLRRLESRIVELEAEIQTIKG